MAPAAKTSKTSPPRTNPHTYAVARSLAALERARRARLAMEGATAKKRAG